MLVGTSDRVATDPRVSLTDRRNLRCTCRMPVEGLNRIIGVSPEGGGLALSSRCPPEDRKPRRVR
ncbi:hypothetical protein JOF53_007626 [Crossiella equi]|uniref:Uncharacterized protein n=1 Tax=Crossiella equi TaxID=130796 RepID=A0ABS5AQA6_9PSEU|nr:hypothetical protein [Crossiella equi]